MCFVVVVVVVVVVNSNSESDLIIFRPFRFNVHIYASTSSNELASDIFYQL